MRRLLLGVVSTLLAGPAAAASMRAVSCGRSTSAIRLLLALLPIAAMLSLPGRSEGVTFDVNGSGYDAFIEFQVPCLTCPPIVNENVVALAPLVSAYMHTTSKGTTSFAGFTMSANLKGKLSIDGRGIGNSNAEDLSVSYPGLELNDTLTPMGPAPGGVYALFPHVELKGEIILDHGFDGVTPPPSGLMQLNFSVIPIAPDGAQGGECQGFGQAITLPVDTPIDMIVGSTECDIRQGGSLRYQLALGEIIGGVTHGSITNAEVHLGDTATVYFGLPDGVTLDSASGAFQNVPEPSTVALLTAGMGFFAAVGRRRSRI